MICPECGYEIETNVRYETIYWCENCEKNFVIKVTDIPFHLLKTKYERIWICPHCNKWDSCVRYYTCERDHRDYTCYRCECGEISSEKSLPIDVKEWDGKKVVIVMD